MEPGDTLGFVGNSGNARTTPPHLHFGIYARRPTDPAPFIRQPAQTPPRLQADTTWLGDFGRTRVRATVWTSTSRPRSEVARLDLATPLRIVAATGSGWIVSWPGGRDNTTEVSAELEAIERLRTK